MIIMLESIQYREVSTTQKSRRKDYLLKRMSKDETINR